MGYIRRVFRIVYISGESSPFSSGDLQELLVQSREKNARLGITGLLLYRQGNFMQVLEGEEVAVRAVFHSITLDPRHHRVIAVVQEPIQSRDFAAWSMAFQDLELLKQPIPPGFSDLLHASWENLDLRVFSDTIRNFIRVFVVATAA